MAYLQARSGIARSGVTYAGWTPPKCVITIAGVDRTTKIHNEVDDWQILLAANNAPTTFHFTAHGFTPAIGDAVSITYATPDNWLFVGTLKELEVGYSRAPTANKIQWQCVAHGSLVTLNQRTVVNRRYQNKGVNTIVADILARFAPSGSRVGYIPSSLGTISDVSFEMVQVSEAISRVADLAGVAAWVVTPDQAGTGSIVSFALAEAALPTLGNSSVIDAITYRQDGTQTRNEVWVRGQGSPVTTAVSLGDTTIAVEDVRPFADGLFVDGVPLGIGWAFGLGTFLTYAGTSVLDGPGTLTGVSFVTGAYNGNVTAPDFPIGTIVSVLGVYPGFDPVGNLGVQFVDAPTLSLNAAYDLALANYTLYGALATIKGLEYDDVVTQAVRPGLALPISITIPQTISATLTVDTVTITPNGPIIGTSVPLRRHVVANLAAKQKFVDLLRQVL